MAAGPPPGPHRWWGPPPAPQPPPATADVMNQLCRVCGEPAAGFHFGAFTCEGCKSFFGRTYNNVGSISECKNNGKCVINKKNRTSCKACRLRKCLIVGMSKSGSRYGRRSNWFKIHCLLQEQQQNHHTMVKPVKGWDSMSFQSKHMLDVDNNNAPNSKDNNNERPISPGMILPRGYNTAGDAAAAALWAARSSMLPVHPHHPTLPFFTPPAFLHNSTFHQTQPPPNFLIPFLPARQLQPEAPVISAPSSTSSSPSPEVKTPVEKPAVTEIINYEKCISALRSLGPVQEVPMDLSVSSRTSSDSRRGNSLNDFDDSSNDNQADRESLNDDDNDEVFSEAPAGTSTNVDTDTHKRTVTTPLDLTCAKS